MRVLTAYPERLSDKKTLYLADSPDSEDVVEYGLQSVRMHQGYALIKLKGVESRDEADKFRELFVMVSMEDAIPLEEGELYLYQFIGLKVQTEDGHLLGEIVDIIETGANDVYVVDSADYGEVLIPDTEEVILEIDIDAGMVVVRLPEGLLPNS